MTVGLDERRRWRRVPIASVPILVRCRRVAVDAREAAVDGIDLSPGGIRFRTPGDLSTGDVVEVLVDAGSIHLALRGLVVYTSRDGSGQRHSHVAFTGIGDSAVQTIAALLATAQPLDSRPPIAG